MRDRGVYVPVDKIPSVWPKISHYIARCDGEYTTSMNMFKLLVDGRRLLFLTIKGSNVQGACIVRIVDGTRRIFRITTLGGDGVNWEECMIDAERYAKEAGCSHIEIQGRRGWLRRLSGYTERYTVIGKEICGDSEDTSPS